SPDARGLTLARVCRCDAAAVAARPRRRVPRLLRFQQRDLHHAVVARRPRELHVREPHLRCDRRTIRLAVRRGAVDRAAPVPRRVGCRIQPPHGPHARAAEPGALSLRPTGWSAIRAVTVLAYVFLFGPVVVVVLLSFNPLEFGSFPLKGVTLRWYAELVHDRQIADAVKTSLMLGSVTALISTIGGVAAALALVR